MIFNTYIKELQNIIYKGFKIFFDSTARLLGYPDNPGMPIIPFDEDAYDRVYGRDLLPKHVTYLPPGQPQYPETLTEALFGTFPYTEPIEKHFYQHESEGYYNFYVENYKELYFLPDWLSGYIQMHFNITIDHSNLELCRDVFFYVVLLYGAIVTIRSNLFWMLAINPYTYPWVFAVDFVDWIYDALAGIVPCFVGIDMVPTFFMMLIGKIADSANHLVFTMPFLPSEGNKVSMLLDGDIQPTEVIQFHYLPYLWYKYPIPDNVRQFWYSERPDILEFMEKNYSQFGLDFRPSTVSIDEITSVVDSVVKLTTPIVSLVSDSTDFLSTNF
jgi:hypothetical protein